MPGVVVGWGSFLWQYWEPGVKSEEIEVKTQEGGAKGARERGGGGGELGIGRGGGRHTAAS